MKLNIEREALDLVFRILLTCGCPVTQTEEKAVFDLLRLRASETEIPYGEVLSIFKPDANTVFRRLGNFAVWQAPIGLGTYSITREHVLRHFASAYHWDHVVANGLGSAYKKAIHVPTWFLGHMLLPVEVTECAADRLTGVYAFENGRIEIQGLFAPSHYKPTSGQIWSVHYAGLLSRLSDTEVKLVRMLLDMNPLLVRFRSDVERINYRDFERHGDYLALCEKRYRTHYGESE